ncbi:hypothetical protein [Chitinimonas sp.]|uniref:hypothetical protein n=1 Tax=Chitinimonas sp. TaxID=1934313 RepID=UPI0035B4084A
MLNETPADDCQAIEALVARFLQAFSQTPDAPVDLGILHSLCLPQALMVKCVGAERQVYDLASFIAPREALLNGGGISGFREYPLEGRTDVFGQIAQHLCSYEKSWLAGGQARQGRGVKTFQLVRMNDGWKISAMAWDDEREHLVCDVEGKLPLPVPVRFSKESGCVYNGRPDPTRR